ncbi:MAG: hypothetical protein HY262_05060 [Chloroflexi bacterium]|nr:hypothetical protein [Chloroflexota bacterium]
MGEVFFSGAWRPALTDPSLMWVQQQGNYTGTHLQPWSCNEVSPTYCHRWPSGNTLLYKDDASLSILAGNPVGDIDYTLSQYDALIGFAPSVGKTTGSGYDILNYAYTDSSDNAYARSTSYYLAAHPQYFYYGYTKYNDAQTFSAGYRPVECHEFLHVLGFDHITDHGITGSQATCMGSYLSSGPGIDDQQLLDATYSVPLFQ